MKLESLNKFILDNNFTTQKDSKVQSNFQTSIFYNPKNLFKEGITEESFVEAYTKLMTNDDFDFSSVSDDNLSEIEKAAKEYFEAVDNDKNGELSEEEVNGLASRDGDINSISDEDIKSLTDELFKEETQEENTIPDNRDVGDVSGRGIGNSRGINGTSVPGVSKSRGNNSKLQANRNTNSNSTPAQDSAKNINQRISEINNEITSLTEQKKVEMANNEAYVSLVSQSQELNKNIFTSEGKIESYTSDLQSVQCDIAAATAELNNTQDAMIFEEYQAAINARKAALRSQINTLKTKKSNLEEKIANEKENLQDLKNKKDETDKEITAYEAENPNAQIDKINSQISKLNDEKSELQTKLENVRKQEVSDSEVYGKMQAYRNSELVAKLLDPLITPETKAKYDKYFKDSHGYSYCDQFVRNAVNDLYSSVIEELGITDEEMSSFTAQELAFLQQSGITGKQYAGEEYIRACVDTKRWGENYQAVLNGSGINLNSAVDITNMTEAEKINAVREGKIYPGMAFLTLKNGQYHVGFIESINKDLTWNTIEGNTFDGKKAGTVGSHKSDATNQYLVGLSDVMAKPYYWMKMKGYSNSIIQNYIYS